MRSSSRHAPAALVLVALGPILAGTGCGKSAGVGTGGRTNEKLGPAPALVASAPSVPRPAQPTHRAVSPASGSATSAPPASASAASASTASSSGSSLPGSSAPPPSTPASGASKAPRPAIVQSPIPFGARRKAEMTSYAMRHYRIDTYRLIEPRAIVIHYTETPDFQSTYNTFAPDTPDSELHELPNTCAHFVVDADGTIHQLVSLGIMCRHTVGLNWTAIGVEHVGYSDAEVLDRPRQMSASLHLVRWLRCRFHIPVADVIGHNESLASPYHHENVSSLRTQTHSDFNHADMQLYRARLRAAGACH